MAEEASVGSVVAFGSWTLTVARSIVELTEVVGVHQFGLIGDMGEADEMPKLALLCLLLGSVALMLFEQRADNAQ